MFSFTFYSYLWTSLAFSSHRSITSRITDAAAEMMYVKDKFDRHSCRYGIDVRKDADRKNLPNTKVKFKKRSYV